jgi:uncharacterized protein YjbI with pentapeptide repeats
MNTKFAGKWAFEVASVGYVGLAPPTDRLSIIKAPHVEPSQLPDNVLFNAYQTDDGTLILQASNGRYVVFDGDGGYSASEKRSESLARFSLEDAGDGPIRIVERDGVKAYYWNKQGDDLKRIEKIADPPKTTLFGKAVRTPGFAEITDMKYLPEADLSWAYLEKEILSDLTLPNADLSHANLARANMAGINLEGEMTNLFQADLSSADLTSAMMASANLSNANLTKAKLWDARLPDAILDDANLWWADLTSALLNQASLVRAHLNHAILVKAELINADLSRADLSYATFVKAATDGMNISGATCTGTVLDDQDLTAVKMDTETTFSEASMQRVDLHQVHLDRCRMPGADLTNANMASVLLHGANLSNATLDSANLAGAQMGSIAMCFSVTDPQELVRFKNALNNFDTVSVKNIFKTNGVTFSEPITITTSPYAEDRVWTVKSGDTLPYKVRAESLGGTEALTVYNPSTPANLADAFMKDVVLTTANLYAVTAPGTQIYGQARLDNAILENADLVGANLGSIDLTKANLRGAQLDGAILTNAKLQGASLEPSDIGKPASLVGANLQETDFSDAKLDRAILTNAAVAVADTTQTDQSDGVWLFDTQRQDPAPYISELNAATTLFKLAPVVAEGLTPGPVSDALRTAFEENGVTLSDEAQIEEREEDAYWQIADGSTSYTITKGCDQDQYTPALIVQSSDVEADPFAIPLTCEKDLQRGAITDDLRDAFATYGKVVLTKEATLTTKVRAIVWQIEHASTYCSLYTLWLGLDDSCEEKLFARPSIPDVRELFWDAGIKLRWQATVATKGDHWRLDNDSNNPFNDSLGYIKFNLLQETDGAPLDVFGFMLRIMRLSKSNQIEYHNIICAKTRISLDELKDTTVCPNGWEVQDNQEQRKPFHLWMRASRPPSPPTCVPSADGTYYCPRSTSSHTE